MPNQVTPQAMLRRMKAANITDSEIERETGINRTTIWRIRESKEKRRVNQSTAKVLHTFWVNRGRP